MRGLADRIAYARAVMREHCPIQEEAAACVLECSLIGIHFLPGEPLLEPELSGAQRPRLADLPGNEDQVGVVALDEIPFVALQLVEQPVAKAPRPGDPDGFLAPN